MVVSKLRYSSYVALVLISKFYRIFLMRTLILFILIFSIELIIIQTVLWLLILFIILYRCRKPLRPLILYLWWIIIIIFNHSCHLSSNVLSHAIFLENRYLDTVFDQVVLILSLTSELIVLECMRWIMILSIIINDLRLAIETFLSSCPLR